MKITQAGPENQPGPLATTPLAQDEKSPPQQSPRRAFWLGVGLAAAIGSVGLGLALLPGLAVLGSLTLALLVGIGWRNTLGLRREYTAGVQFCAKKVLRYGIILAGVRLNFGLLASSGVQVLLLDVVLIGLGLLVIPWLAVKMGVPKGLALLIAVGQTICGASAVGAAASVSPDAKEEDVSLAVALCGLVGTLGVLGFVFSALIFELPSRFYGLLTGSTLHEIAQVVAAGPSGGPAAADLAMVVKLTRVVLLAPVIVGLALLLGRDRAADGPKKPFSWKNLPLPWFVLGFLAVGMLNSLGWLTPIAPYILQASLFLMVVAMAAMGLLLDLAAVRRVGLKALGAATVAFGLYIIASLALIALLG